MASISLARFGGLTTCGFSPRSTSPSVSTWHHQKLWLGFLWGGSLAFVGLGLVVWLFSAGLPRVQGFSGWSSETFRV